MLAMEMKSCGAYVSRSLSFKQAEVFCCFCCPHHLRFDEIFVAELSKR